MSTPISTKLEVVLSPVTTPDLPALAEGQWLCFGETVGVSYSILEPPSLRPPHPIRVARTARRNLRLLRSPHILMIKATLPDTGELVGLAVWHRPGAPVRNLHIRAPEEEEFEEDRESWEGVDQEAWDGMYIGCDIVRKEIMGDEPHWHLGPLWVLPVYQGRGIATKLIQHVIDLADQETPPTAMYLEASSAGIPVYQKLGYRVVGDPDVEFKSMLRRGRM